MKMKLEFKCIVCKLGFLHRPIFIQHITTHEGSDLARCIDYLAKSIIDANIKLENNDKMITFIKEKQLKMIEENNILFQQLLDANASTSVMKDIKKITDIHLKKYIDDTYTTTPNLEEINFDSLTRSKLLSFIKLGDKVETTLQIFRTFILNNDHKTVPLWHISGIKYVYRDNNKWIEDINGLNICKIIFNKLLKKIIDIENDLISEFSKNLDTDEVANIRTTVHEIKPYKNYLISQEYQIKILTKFAKIISIKQQMLENNINTKPVKPVETTVATNPVQS